MKTIKEVKTEIVVGEALKIGDRTLYPVIKVLTLNMEGPTSAGLFKPMVTSQGNLDFFAVWVSPIAIVVVEPAQNYAIPLTEETITLEQILEMVPSLREKIKVQIK